MYLGLSLDLLLDVLIDDCMDAGGRVMQERLTEKKQQSATLTCYLNFIL